MKESTVAVVVLDPDGNVHTTKGFTGPNHETVLGSANEYFLGQAKKLWPKEFKNISLISPVPEYRFLGNMGWGIHLFPVAVKRIK